MSDGGKLILSPFTGRRKRKAWKTREKYMPVKRRQKKQTGDHITKEEWSGKNLDNKGAFYNGNEGNNDDES